MKLTKKKIKELHEKGKKAGLFQELSAQDIENLKLPYYVEGAKIRFPVDIDKGIIQSSLEQMRLNDNSFTLNTTINKEFQWTGEVDNLKVLQDNEVICNLIILDKQLALFLEEENAYTIEPILKFNGTKTKYFTFESFMLVKLEPSEMAGVEADPIAKVETEEFVAKVDYDVIVTEFEKLKTETLKAINNFENNIGTLNDTMAVKVTEISTLNKKLKSTTKEIADKDIILKIKDDSIAMFQNRMKQAEAKVTSFKTQVKKQESDKKLAKFNEMFNNYCTAHEIQDDELESKRKELSSLGDSSIEMLNKDSLKMIGNFSQVEEPIVNSQAEIRTVKVTSNNSTDIPVLSETMDDLFSKLQTINNN